MSLNFDFPMCKYHEALNLECDIIHLEQKVGKHLISSNEIIENK